jgi:hypothetical protein
MICRRNVSDCRGVTAFQIEKLLQARAQQDEKKATPAGDGGDEPSAKQNDHGE